MLTEILLKEAEARIDIIVKDLADSLEKQNLEIDYVSVQFQEIISFGEKPHNILKNTKITARAY